jgi:hypothetical protein
MKVNYIELYIIPLIVGIVFILISLIHFSKNVAADISIKFMIILVVTFICCSFLIDIGPVCFSFFQ